MKEYDGLLPEELEGLARLGADDRNWQGSYLCMECISELELGFETWSKPHTHCAKCRAKTTLYKSIKRGHL